MSRYSDNISFTHEDAVQRASQVDKAEGAGSFTQPVGSVPIQVVGTHGKVRHAGTFRPDNPYAAQIATATNNQDRDALYERAIEWEADRSNYEFQQEQNRDILLEQRRYDSPAEVAARNREAGFAGNGSSGAAGASGSSAQQQPVSLADQNGQTPFSNSYANTSLAFQGIQTVSDFVSSFTSSVSILNSFSEALATFSDRKTYQHNQARMSEVSASTAESTKEDVISLSKNSRRLQTAELANDYITQLGDIASLIPRDTKDEDISSFLSDIGYDDDTSQKLAKGIQRIRQSDAMQKFYNEQQLAKEDTDAQVPVYTSERLKPMHEFLLQAKLDEATSKAIKSNFIKTFTELFNTPEIAESMANIETAKLSLSAEQTALLRRNLTSLAKQIDTRNIDRAKHVESLKKRRAEIEARGKEVNWRGKEKGLNKHEIAEITSIDTRIAYIESLANEELGEIYKSMYTFGAQSYLIDARSDGFYTPLDRIFNKPYATLLFTEYENNPESSPISDFISILLNKRVPGVK